MTLARTGLKWYMAAQDIGVIIPAFNAEASIGKILKALIEYGIEKKNIILVDDGSLDRTAVVALGYGVDVIKVKKNMGKGWALNLGFSHARLKNLDTVITMDADGQHLVSDIGCFIARLSQHDLLIGSRRENIGSMPFSRQVVNKMTSLVISLLSKKHISDVQSGFRLINLHIFDKIKLRTKNFQTESELVYKAIKGNYKVGCIPITTVYNGQKSYIMPVRDTLRFIAMAVRFLWA